MYTQVGVEMEVEVEVEVAKTRNRLMRRRFERTVMGRWFFGFHENSCTLIEGGNKRGLL